VMDRLVCPLISVLCSYEIVKRVVTVKQVRPSPIISEGWEVGPGHGYVLPVRACTGRGGVRASAQRSKIRGQRSESVASGHVAGAWLSDL
jgi:hypothetical protein